MPRLKEHCGHCPEDQVFNSPEFQALLQQAKNLPSADVIDRLEWLMDRVGSDLNLPEENVNELMGQLSSKAFDELSELGDPADHPTATDAEREVARAEHYHRPGEALEPDEVTVSKQLIDSLTEDEYTCTCHSPEPVKNYVKQSDVEKFKNGEGVEYIHGPGPGVVSLTVCDKCKGMLN